jgi:hypothetical protein
MAMSYGAGSSSKNLGKSLIWAEMATGFELCGLRIRSFIGQNRVSALTPMPALFCGILSIGILPAERIPLREVLQSKMAHHPKALSAMVHAVRGEMDKGGANGFLARGVIKIIGENIVVAATGREGFSKRGKLGGDNVETGKQDVDVFGRRLHAGALCTGEHKVTPAFHIGHDVLKSASKGAMSHVEGLIKLGIGKAGSTGQE